jgi:hypothetical protein
MQTWRTSVYVMGLVGWFLLFVPTLRADEKNEQGTVVEGAGFSLFDTESIKGFDEKKVEHDPVCDRSKRPRIAKVEPDEAKPGDKIMISGENLGTME